MRLLALLLLSLPAFAVDMVELKNGKVIPAEAVVAADGKLRIRVLVPGQASVVEYAVPFEQVVPEFVYYAWAEQIAPADAGGHRDLGDWARGQGLFRQALAQYEQAAAGDDGATAALPALRATLREEEATWLFDEAWRLFREGEVKGARRRAERVLSDFADSGELARCSDLLRIIGEREQFLSEQKRAEEIARRARGHRRDMQKELERVDRADRMVREARLGSRADARRMLAWAAYAYRSAGIRFEELLAIVEVDDLRLALRALLDDLGPRLVNTFLKLGDARFLAGDQEGALDAVHEVLAIDPGHKGAHGLRDRILDREARAAEPAPVVYGGIRYPYPWALRRARLVRCGTLPTVGAPFGVFDARYLGIVGVDGCLR